MQNAKLDEVNAKCTMHNTQYKMQNCKLKGSHRREPTKPSLAREVGGEADG